MFVFVTVYEIFGFEFCDFMQGGCDILERSCSLDITSIVCLATTLRKKDQTLSINSETFWKRFRLDTRRIDTSTMNKNVELPVIIGENNFLI